ncbi:MAG: DNA polymerase III subunit delta [Bacteroidales bacterium]|nr:DNA polymerase III subunit delta [Bacteroidales bacterium]
MAGFADIERQYAQLLDQIRSRAFVPVYLLMGDEPFYTDRLCDAIVENALDEEERDFNETICYGSDVDADTVITAARRFPMMAERQLGVVKEAQAMRDLEKVAVYLEQPLDSTILVLLLRGASADKRKSLYKLASKTGVVFESKALRDYEMPAWISAYFSGRGMRIAPDAAALLAEYAGTDMSKIVLEADKLARNLPEGGGEVRSADIEAQVGISRTVSIFELTRELSLKNGPKALNLAARIGAAPRFAMPMAVSALYTHFNRILRYAALKERNRYPDKSAVAAVLQGVNPYFWKEYDAAVANYPIRRLIGIISLLCEYDYKGKGGDAGETLPGDLLVELVAKILS